MISVLLIIEFVWQEAVRIDYEILSFTPEEIYCRLTIIFV